MRTIIVLSLTLCTSTFFTNKAAARKVTVEQIRIEISKLSTFKDQKSIDIFLDTFSSEIPSYRSFKAWVAEGYRTLFSVQTDTHYITYEYFVEVAQRNNDLDAETPTSYSIPYDFVNCEAFEEGSDNERS